LEEEVLITENGMKPISRYPFDERLLGRQL
jgi:hypothetical protein